METFISSERKADLAMEACKVAILSKRDVIDVYNEMLKDYEKLLHHIEESDTFTNLGNK